MTVIYANDGKLADLSNILSSYSRTVKLFQSNTTPDETTELGDLTEADFSGYTGIAPTWGAMTINGDDNAEVVGLTIEFEHSGGATDNDVYGWYLEGNVGGTPTLIYSERFGDAPRVMDGAGDKIFITPSLAQGGCPA